MFILVWILAAIQNYLIKTICTNIFSEIDKICKSDNALRSRTLRAHVSPVIFFEMTKIPYF